MSLESTIPRITLMRRVRRAAIVAAAVLAGAALVSACGSSASSKAKTNLDTAHVALSIEQSIFSQRHLHAKVTCPTAVPQEQGRHFTCVATVFTAHKKGKATANGKTPATVTTSFVVTEQNNAGYVTYRGE